jgi:hypothetical protein
VSTSNMFLGTGDVCVNNRADSVLWMNRLHKISITYNFNMLFKFQNLKILFKFSVPCFNCFKTLVWNSGFLSCVLFDFNV